MTPRENAALQDASTYMTNVMPQIAEWYIIGGFWRDALLGRPFRDIDIFIPHEDTPVDADGVDYELGHNFTANYGDTEINIIHMPVKHTLQSLVERCDLGICQIGSVKNCRDTLYMSEAFTRDWTHKTLTLMRETRKNHVERMIAKFPEFKFCNPNNFVMHGPKDDSMFDALDEITEHGEKQPGDF